MFKIKKSLCAVLSQITWQLRGIAPERGSYSRIGACPYLPPQLINSRCCPCKGLISWAGLAPQHLSRYEPLTGARFINRLQEVGASPYPKYEPLSGALARQIRDIRAALRGLKAQQVRSPGQRPGLTCVPHLRPVRAKVINHRCAHTFALTGRRSLYADTQGVALGSELAALSGRSRRQLRGIAPVRGSYLESCCGASPAHDMRPLQGQQRELMSTGGR